MAEHERTDNTPAESSAFRVSRVFSERLRKGDIADITFRTKEHAVNKARVRAYQVEYGQARERGDRERMATILTTIRSLCADSRRLLAENRATLARLHWRTKQAASAP